MLSPYDFSHEHLLYEQPTTLGSLTLTVKQIIVCVFLSVYQVFKKKINSQICQFYDIRDTKIIIWKVYFSNDTYFLE